MRAVLIPVKAFGEAKLRLAGVLDGAARGALARQLAARVVTAGGDNVYVVCDDGEVADWAIEHNATVLYAPGVGLSAAVEAGVGYLASHGFGLVTVAHADLPFAHDLAVFGSDSGVTIAPDRKRDGTNVIGLPTDSGFRFSYGPGSFQRHTAEARRLGLDCRIVDDSELSVDIDVPSDLDLLAGIPAFETTIGMS